MWGGRILQLIFHFKFILLNNSIMKIFFLSRNIFVSTTLIIWQINCSNHCFNTCSFQRRKSFTVISVSTLLSCLCLCSYVPLSWIMNIPKFDDIFKQIKTNFWVIGIPFDQPKIKLRYFILFFLVFTMVVQEGAFFCSNISAENFLELTQLAPYACCGWLTVIKLLFITTKRQKIFDLTRCLKELYDKMLTDPKKQEIVRRDFTFLKTLVKYFFILNLILIIVCNFSTLIFITYHYYMEKVIRYRLPYAIVVPFSTDMWYTWLIAYLHSISSGKWIFCLMCEIVSYKLDFTKFYAIEFL